MNVRLERKGGMAMATPDESKANIVLCGGDDSGYDTVTRRTTCVV
jgi:hypothetical protein